MEASITHKQERELDARVAEKVMQERVIWEEHPEALRPLQESICPDRGTFTPQ